MFKLLSLSHFCYGLESLHVLLKQCKALTTLLCTFVNVVFIRNMLGKWDNFLSGTKGRPAYHLLCNGRFFKLCVPQLQCKTNAYAHPSVPAGIATVGLGDKRNWCTYQCLEQSALPSRIPVLSHELFIIDLVPIALDGVHIVTHFPPWKLCSTPLC